MFSHNRKCHQPEPDPGQLSFQLRHTRRCLRQLCSLGRCLQPHRLSLLLRLRSLPLKSVRLRLRLLALCAEPGGLLEVLACRGRLLCSFQLRYRLRCLCCLRPQSLRMSVEASCPALQRIGFVCQPLNAPAASTASHSDKRVTSNRNATVGLATAEGKDLLALAGQPCRLPGYRLQACTRCGLLRSQAFLHRCLRRLMLSFLLLLALPQVFKPQQALAFLAITHAGRLPPNL